MKGTRATRLKIEPRQFFWRTACRAKEVGVGTGGGGSGSLKMMMERELIGSVAYVNSRVFRWRGGTINTGMPS